MRLDWVGLMGREKGELALEHGVDFYLGRNPMAFDKSRQAITAREGEREKDGCVRGNPRSTAVREG